MGTLLDYGADPVALTAALIDIPSVSRDETAIADAVEVYLSHQEHLHVQRSGNCLLAQTQLGLPRRVVLAGHLDTVPVADNIPHRTYSSDDHGSVISGLGAVDMKSGDAVFLALSQALTNPAVDISYIFYDCEEIEAVYNGLGHIEKQHPHWLRGDVAILGEPTNGLIEAGCQGVLRAAISTTGIRAHAARGWMGSNAIHKLDQVLRVLADYSTLDVPIDGCVYREGLNAVRIHSGIAGNVIPDTAEVEINFRFAPNRSVDQAIEYIKDIFSSALNDEVTLTITDAAAGALPGLDKPITQELVAAADGKFRAKYGWTDVARFAAHGIPAVNLGPGDPSLAHKPEEFVSEKEIRQVYDMLYKFLTHRSADSQ